jgi:hypothetical protein
LKQEQKQKQEQNYEQNQEEEKLLWGREGQLQEQEQGTQHWCGKAVSAAAVAVAAIWLAVAGHR